MGGDAKKPRITIVTGTGAGAMRFLGGDGQAPIRDQIGAPAIVRGLHGRAWRVDLQACRQVLNVAEADDGTLAHWVIEAPEYHPAWHSYSLVLLHLRPMPDARETLIYLDDATHELWVYVIDPAADRNRMLVDPRGWSWLQPKNFAAQFIAADDAAAGERVRQAVQAICDGRLSPDTDFQHAWAALFGDNMMKDRPNARRPRVRR